MPAVTSMTEGFLARSDLDQLIAALRENGYVVVGPTIDQGAIVYDEIASAADLPVGWTDQQQPGQYRLEQRNDDACFGYVVGPHSWKKYLFPPLTTVASAERNGETWTMSTPGDDAESPQYAFLGVRACELAAIGIQDRVFMGDTFTDPTYARRRNAALIVAVNCTEAASTCFCTSMNTGPRCTAGFDLALTEIAEGFVIEAATTAGQTILEQLPKTPVTEEHDESAQSARRQAVDQISRQMDTDGLQELLRRNLNHPQWEDVAARCLSCTNCTMVCPTCFCATVKDVPDLTGNHVERQRSWDSCFNIDFSYMNGGIARNSIRSRYRQWLTHKLSSWHDQFGTSGCVGCGRCITWCPTGIDLTAEVAAIRASDGHAVIAEAAAEVKP